MYRLKYFALLVALSAFQPGVSPDSIETYQLALENEPEYRSTYLNQHSTGEITSQSIARMLPNLSFTGNSSRDRLHNKKATFQRAGTQNLWSK